MALSLTGAAGVLLGTAGATYLLATTFEEEAQAAYDGGRTLRGVGVTVFLVVTALVFASSGSPSLMIMALLIVVFATMYLIFDHYSPFNRRGRP